MPESVKSRADRAASLPYFSLDSKIRGMCGELSAKCACLRVLLDAEIYSTLFAKNDIATLSLVFTHALPRKLLRICLRFALDDCEIARPM